MEDKKHSLKLYCLRVVQNLNGFHEMGQMNFIIQFPEQRVDIIL